jgi:hypothetical protein
VSDLRAGDLCEIVPSGEIYWRVMFPGAFGMRVVLTRIDTSECTPWQLPYKPFWCASGLPSGLLAVSWKCLRKLPPPPPLEEDIDELDEVGA